MSASSETSANSEYTPAADEGRPRPAGRKRGYSEYQLRSTGRTGEPHPGGETDGSHQVGRRTGKCQLRHPGEDEQQRAGRVERHREV